MIKKIYKPLWNKSKTCVSRIIDKLKQQPKETGMQFYQRRYRIFRKLWK